MIYRGCQKNVPIKDRFSATNPYAASYFRIIFMRSGITADGYLISDTDTLFLTKMQKRANPSE